MISESYYKKVDFATKWSARLFFVIGVVGLLLKEKLSVSGHCRLYSHMPKPFSLLATQWLLSLPKTW